MFNAMNSLSETDSLLKVPIWKNKWLCYAIFTSVFLHVLIIKIPLLNIIFGTVNLSLY